MLAGACNRSIDQMSRAARSPELAMMDQHLHLKRAHNLPQSRTDAPAQGQLATLTSNAGLENNAARHTSIRPGVSLAVNSGPHRSLRSQSIQAGCALITVRGAFPARSRTASARPPRLTAKKKRGSVEPHFALNHGSAIQQLI
jgi:hypothetical protein